MRARRILGFIAAALALLCLHARAGAAGQAEDAIAATAQSFLGKSFNTDWSGLEKLPGTRWAPLPPKMLDNCLPDGGCFARQGTATLGGRNMSVLASGARTIVTHVYLRNSGTPIGEGSVLGALKAAGFGAELARCPVPGSHGGTNWYRLKSARTNPGYLAVQSSCNGKPCEGFVLSAGEQLPPLQPNQLRLYSEQCGGTASERKPVATALPHQQLATLLAALLPRADGPALPEWKSLPGLSPTLQWTPGGPRTWDLSYKNDPNPLAQSGSMTLSGRAYSLLASGSATQALVLYIDENGLHPRAEDVLAALRAQGHALQLVRCGPVYTESTNDWYRVTSPGTRAVMLQQSVRRDGKQFQSAYVLRFDGSLPKRDPRDRDPGVGGCK